MDVLAMTPIHVYNTCYTYEGRGSSRPYESCLKIFRVMVERQHERLHDIDVSVFNND